MALDFLWPNLDQRPALEILAEAWDKDVIQTQLMLNDKYGTAGFYEIRQELESLGYGFVEQGAGYGATKTRGFVKTVGETGTFSTYPAEIGVNSNATTTVHGNSTAALEMTKDASTGKLSFSGLAKNGFKMFANGAGTALNTFACVSTGCFLGKTIDSTLYNANPQFWNSIGLETLNPETWNSITRGDNSFGAGLVNFLLGLNPTTGEAIGYLDENALAYMAYCMYMNGVFSSGSLSIQDVTIDGISDVTGPLYFDRYNLDTLVYGNSSHSDSSRRYICSTPVALHPRYGSLYIGCSVSNGPIECSATLTGDRIIFASDRQSSVASFGLYEYNSASDYYGLSASTSMGTQTYNNKTYCYASLSASDTVVYAFPVSPEQQSASTSKWIHLAYLLLYGTATGGSSIDGIGNQPNATLPDTTGWDDLNNVLPSLQQQYPDMFNDPLIQHAYDPDGTENITRYVPVPLPSAKSLSDTQPTTGTQTQTQPQENPATNLSTMPEELLNLITRMAVPNTTMDPAPTGNGESPAPVAPTGSASALWSVYHPSQAQVDSFGAWLWSSNIITQIQQVLQNPMDGIITLHKVFASPIDSGTGTIVVGRLDSQVASATVTEQYVEIDCGSVNCSEYFGTVFDYDPYTSVHLYLPFIGIVPLNVSEVMRSTVTVKYGVDVFTGACLAMVEISRDGNTVNMYQYSGVASVEYPLTGAVHSGLLSGLFGVASGIAGIAMASTGVGIAAGATAIGAGVANMSKSQNAHASGFSGNSGAMGIKIPYLIIERPQVKTADTFPVLDGYPTNYSIRLGDCSNHVVCKTVHVNGIAATKSELEQIEMLLKSGVEV